MSGTGDQRSNDWAREADADPSDGTVGDAPGPDDTRPDGSARSGVGGTRGPARQSNRWTRLVVLVVLLGLLAGAIALEQSEPDVGGPAVAVRRIGAPEIPPADALSTAWYCAAGTASADDADDETVYIGNLSPEQITAEVTVDPGGSDPPVTQRVRIEPYGREGVAVSDVLDAPSPGVVVEVAGGAAVVEHEIRGNGDLAMSPCAPEPSATWYFAAGSTLRGASQALELFNPFGDDAIVDIAFLTEGGVQEPQALQGFVVSRRSKVRVPVGDDVVARQERVATVVRARTGRVVAEQVGSYDGTDGRSGLTLSLGTAEPSTRWTIPVAAAESGAAGGVAVANFGLSPTTVDVSVQLSGEGVLTPDTVEVPPRSVVRVDPTPRIPFGTAYSVIVRSQTDVPVVAESIVTTGAGAAWSGGSTVTARRWALAGAPDDASSAVLATNRSSGPLTVELRAYTAGDVDSPRSSPAIAVEPGKTARFDLGERGIDPDQVLVIAADGPIVVGRETYAGGVSLALALPFRG